MLKTLLIMLVTATVIACGCLAVLFCICSTDFNPDRDDVDNDPHR
jgi:hypothetical protein